MKIKFSFLIGLGLIFMLLLISCQSGIESTTVTTTTAATLTSTVVPQASLEPSNFLRLRSGNKALAGK